MPVIFRVRREYERLWEQANRMLPVQVTSAIELDEATTESIGASIGQSTSRKVTLSTRVDPDILGGIVLRVGNSILDASIKKPTGATAQAGGVRRRLREIADRPHRH